MADRFPSIEDFSEDQAQKDDGGLGDLDAGDDFITRERAALGDDADQFTTPGDRLHSSAKVEDGDDLLGAEDDLLGGSGPVNDSGDTSAFETSFPAVDTSNERVAPGGTITGSAQPQPSYSSFGASQEEPEVIREWRERRDLALAHRAETAAKKKAQTQKEARENIDDFYENYNTKKDKQISQTRKEAEEFLASREDTSAGGTSWERIAKLVDLSGKGSKGGAAGTGKERFRELLTSLKKDEKAPGASGV